jgi:nitroreductase
MTLLPTSASVAAVDDAITTRRSIRAFLPTPVTRQEIEAILAVAARAPSGTNTQPWRVHVLTGQAKAALSAEIRAAFDDPAQRAQHTEEYAYYPTQWQSPLHRPPSQGGLGLVFAAGHRQGGQGTHAPAARQEL